MWAGVLLLGSAAAALGSAAAATPPTELFLVPHSHCDVGWLQTVDSLARVNVSRIINGVVGNLANDTRGRRRFVWDEMAFLQRWWDQEATPGQRETFRTLVQTGKIELVDNGWSQHDMGCTTLDSMVNNWVQGHQWINRTLGSGVRPRVGWSLDPFGQSTTQAVLQALSGMDAWFFTRLSKEVVADMKAQKGLEFVWRASSSLPEEQTEMFVHVFESYYCMPLPTYAFEWGARKGAIVPNSANVVNLAWKLANITQQRRQWFRTPNVLIPWGCDYQYQNAALVYNSTDWLIDVINEHPEWGVHARYATPSEYLASVRSSAAGAKPKVQFPVKKAGTTFFPYNDWSGYFTSRPALKGLSAKAHASLHAAEVGFALHPAANRSAMWPLLESARENAGIVQHHDAITGTYCVAEEGCAGTDQVIGPHDLQKDYSRMLTDAVTSSAKVLEGVASAVLNASLTADDETVLGKLLMGNGASTGGTPGVVTLFNPLGWRRTEAVSVQIPVCSVRVESEETGEPVLSQVTVMFDVNDGIAPYYDFTLSFTADLPALGWATYRVIPTVGSCGGGDMLSRDAVYSPHRYVWRSPLWQPHGAPLQYTGDDRAALQELSGHERKALLHQAEAVCAADSDPTQCQRMAASSAEPAEPKARAPDYVPGSFVLENQFLMVHVSPARGLEAVYDKESRTNHTLTHELVQYTATANNAYSFTPDGPARPVLSQTFGKNVSCGAWRQTADCDATGKRDPLHDKSCNVQLPWNVSGYCECADGEQRHAVGCQLNRPPFTCNQVCAGLPVLQPLVAVTASLGPVLQEARLQVTKEHKTRIRLWVTADPVVGRRIEVASKVGILPPMTDLAARFTSPDLAGDGATFWSEDNGYETIPHQPGLTNPDRKNGGGIADNYYPSQQSCFMTGPNGTSQVQLSLALDRSHAVGSVVPGSMDVLIHRRGGPYDGFGSTVVLDDTDRVLVDSWLSIGGVVRSNRMRHQSKLRITHPPRQLFGPAPTGVRLRTVGGAPTFPPNLHLQSARATVANASQALLRLQHLYGATESFDPDMASPVSFDLPGFLAAAGLRTPT
eukprot:TRINITY_DN18099_c0_g1_i1.p1 TRINITY_DN18099_c0_g1~~TRINITY_DN18099_c0_g1_i1.p1  ORF type:complete len:1069 (+),score=319.29 TRINITY_DN18099_c0_g1_i1:58-3264(+)